MSAFTEDARHTTRAASMLIAIANDLRKASLMPAVSDAERDKAEWAHGELLHLAREIDEVAAELRREEILEPAE
jgi:hypothetical protein